MLNYKNDSLLLKKETANDLIEKGFTNLIFLGHERKTLNIFSALVKKEDFIRGNKICQPLQKSPYAKISIGLIKHIENKFKDKNRLIKLLEIYIDRRSNIKNSIERWFKERRVPLILLRVISTDIEEFSKFIDEIEYFTDFLNKSRFYCPKQFDELLDKKLIYLVGCSVGDGHINKACKRWTLVDGSSKAEKVQLSKEFILRIANLIKGQVNSYEIKEYPTKYAIRINNKLFCRFLNFFFGLPIGKKKESILRKPHIMSLSKNNLEKYFWRGCFDTDGSVIKQGAVDFSSSDRYLLTECESYLHSLKINPKKSEHNVTVNLPDINKFSYIGFAHPRKQLEMLEILKRGSKYKSVRINGPMDIDKKLLKIYPALRIDNNYRIRIHSRELRKLNIDEKEIMELVNKLFGYELKKTTNNLLYFKSRKIYNLLNSSFIFEQYCKAIKTDEEDRLLNEWNDVWCKK